MLNILLDLFFPKKCAGCGKEGSYFCRNCQQEITQKELICPWCKKRSFGGITHPICQRQAYLDGLWSFGAYQGGLRRAIQKLKYRFITEQAEILTDLVIEYLARSRPIFLEQIIRSGGKNWAITYVPLHWQRQNWRGFNQSQLLAQKIAHKLGISYIEALSRTKNTHTQTTYDAHTRRLNIKNAFAVSPINDLRLTINILLVDDVWTTGSTLQECCYVLKKAGAQKVWGITLAR